MADQSASGIMTGQGGTAHGALAHDSAQHASHHGSPVSWVAVTIIMIGFLIGGIAMVPGPRWWLFWTGAAIALVGCIGTAVARTFDNDWY